MLTPEFLWKITERTEQAVSRFNESMVRRVVKRILSLFEKEGTVSITPSSIHDIQKIKESGKLYDEIVEEVSKRSPEIQEEVKRAFKDVEQKINADNVKTTAEIVGEDAAEAEIEQAGKLTPKEQRLMERAYNATNGEIHNLTRTTAEEWQKTYIDSCDEAYWKATHGVSLNQAVREAIDRVAAQGSKVKYPSGHEDTIEVAIARAVRTGVNQAAGDVTLARCAESGAGHVVVSSHIGARVTDKDEPANHASWQGKVYALDWNKPELAKYKPTLQEEKENEVRGFLVFRKMKDSFQIFRKRKKGFPDFIETTGYGSGEGLCGWNCRHSFFMFDPDINTNNQAQYDVKENEEYYNLTQEQRKMERAIRKTKRRLNAAEYAMETSNDTLQQEEQESQIRHLDQLLQKQQKAYTDFCRDHNLKRLEDRLYVAKKYGVPNGYENGQLEEKPIEIGGNSDTIKSLSTKEAADVHFVGRINKDIYKCVTEDIVTDEVIITNERIEHIIQRRGQIFYDKYAEHFKEIIEDPDYIFKDKENTALVCKEVLKDGKYVNLALRIITSTDNVSYKNSIITAVGENEKRFRQRLRNNVPLYKRE